MDEIKDDSMHTALDDFIYCEDRPRKSHSIVIFTSHQTLLKPAWLRMHEQMLWIDVIRLFCMMKFIFSLNIVCLSGKCFKKIREQIPIDAVIKKSSDN